MCDNVQDRELLVKELNAIKIIIDDSESFESFFSDNFEYIRLKKMYMNNWVGFKYRKVPHMYDLYIQNIMRMFYIDIKYGNMFYLSDSEPPNIL